MNTTYHIHKQNQQADTPSTASHSLCNGWEYTLTLSGLDFLPHRNYTAETRRAVPAGVEHPRERGRPALFRMQSLQTGILQDPCMAFVPGETELTIIHTFKEVW